MKRGLSLRLGGTVGDDVTCPAEKAQLDTHRLSRREAAILLANLRRSGREQLADAIGRELDLPALSPGPTHGGAPVDPEAAHTAGKISIRTAAGGVASATVAAGVLIALMVALPPSRAPRTTTMTLARPPAEAAPPPRIESASVEDRGASRAVPTVKVLRSGPAGLRPSRPVRAAPPLAAIVVAEAAVPADPLPQRIALEAVDAVELAAAPASTSPGLPQPVVLAQGDLGRLLGRAPDRSDPLRGLHSGNPVRMATAVSAAR